jgi:hypothetical protein
LFLNFNPLFQIISSPLRIPQPHRQYVASTNPPPNFLHFPRGFRPHSSFVKVHFCELLSTVGTHFNLIYFSFLTKPFSLSSNSFVRHFLELSHPNRFKFIFLPVFLNFTSSLSNEVSQEIPQFSLRYSPPPSNSPLPNDFLVSPPPTLLYQNNRTQLWKLLQEFEMRPITQFLSRQMAKVF